MKLHYRNIEIYHNIQIILKHKICTWFFQKWPCIKVCSKFDKSATDFILMVRETIMRILNITQYLLHNLGILEFAQFFFFLCVWPGIVWVLVIDEITNNTCIHTSFEIHTEPFFFPFIPTLKISSSKDSFTQHYFLIMYYL